MNIFNYYIHGIPDYCGTVTIKNGSQTDRLYITRNNNNLKITDYDGYVTHTITPNMFDAKKNILESNYSLKTGKFILYNENMNEEITFKSIDKPFKYSYDIQIDKIIGKDYVIEFEYYKDGSLFSLYIKNSETGESKYITYLYS